MEHWLEREIAQWVHPMEDRSDDPSHHERTLYHGAPSRSAFSTRRQHASKCSIRFVRAHSEQAAIAHACHGHTPVINWPVCLGQKVSS